MHVFVAAPFGELGVTLRFVVNCDNYPNSPVSVSFISPIPKPENVGAHEACWPDDSEARFRIRTAFPGPFICMPGCRSYAPETRPENPYSAEDCRIGSILWNIYFEIHSGRVHGVIFDGR